MPADALFLGPHLGSNRGWALSPEEILATALAERGFEVHIASAKVGSVPRAVDILRTMVRDRASRLAVVTTHSGRGFRLVELVTRLAPMLGLPTVLFLHGGDLPAFHGRHPKRVARTLARGTRLLAPSPYLADYFRSCGFEIDVVPNPTDLEVIPFRVRGELEPRILWMRAFHDIYGADTAVRTFALVRQRHPHARMTMAGRDEGTLDSTRQLARELGLEDTIAFPGFLAGSQKREVLETHDVLLTTSRVDNAPTTLVEAAAAGLPIVSTEAGGIPCLWTHGDTALLASVDDETALARAVGELLDSPQLVRTMSNAARAVAETHSLSVVLPVWEKLIRSFRNGGGR